MRAASGVTPVGILNETNSLGEVDAPRAKLGGAQRQRPLEHFSIGQDLIPRKMITACATLKQGAANTNHKAGRLDAIMRTQPMIIIGGILQRNPVFVLPPEFPRELRERRAGQSVSTSTGSRHAPTV